MFSASNVELEYAHLYKNDQSNVRTSKAELNNELLQLTK